MIFQVERINQSVFENDEGGVMKKRGVDHHTTPLERHEEKKKFEMNEWNPHYMSIATITRWKWFFTRIIVSNTF